jgi:hypothetical protein
MPNEAIVGRETAPTAVKLASVVLRGELPNHSNVLTSVVSNK